MKKLSFLTLSLFTILLLTSCEDPAPKVSRTCTFNNVPVNCDTNVPLSKKESKPIEREISITVKFAIEEDKIHILPDQPLYNVVFIDNEGSKSRCSIGPEKEVKYLVELFEDRVELTEAIKNGQKAILKRISKVNENSENHLNGEYSVEGEKDLKVIFSEDEIKFIDICRA